MKMIMGIFVGIFVWGWAGDVGAAALTEERKVELLLDRVEESGFRFVRNGKEYGAREAREHLEMKFERATKSWFGGRRKVTAIDFIEKLASRSSMSGEPYLLKKADGSVIEAEIWLKQQLRAIETS